MVLDHSDFEYGLNLLQSDIVASSSVGSDRHVLFSWYPSYFSGDVLLAKFCACASALVCLSQV